MATDRKIVNTSRNFFERDRICLISSFWIILDTPQKIATAYNAADVFVLPSREDNLPNTMLESFACGTPIISFATGGMKEHIANTKNGILAKEISAVSLAKAISLFFEHKNNYTPSTIRAYAETHFSFKKQAQAYIQTYNSINQIKET